MKNNKSKIKNNGFSLIEMLVAMGISLSLIGVVAGLFIAGIRQQKASLSFQSLLDQTSYDFEYMSRALRMAIRETNCVDQTDPSTCQCLNDAGYGYGYNYEITPRGGLKFINHLQGDDCQEFYLDTNTNQIMYWRQSDPNNPPLPITSSKITVQSLKFKLVGESQSDTIQPLVTISAQIQTPTTALGQRTINIQTSVSQRNLDFQY